jgi:hypothetical protein
MLVRSLIALTFAALTASPALADDPLRPDPKLTPGAVLTIDTATICMRGYSKTVRHTSGRLKHQVYAEYGIDAVGGHYEVDHLVPLSIGGADVRPNLWPQSVDTMPWNAIVKDRLEERLHMLVCAGELPIERAQREIAADWIAAYRKYLGGPGGNR